MLVTSRASPPTALATSTQARLISGFVFRPEVEILSTVDDVMESATRRKDRSQRITLTLTTTTTMMTMMMMVMVVDIKCYTSSNVGVPLRVPTYFASASQTFIS